MDGGMASECDRLTVGGTEVIKKDWSLEGRWEERLE